VEVKLYTFLTLVLGGGKKNNKILDWRLDELQRKISGFVWPLRM
jgi:hypothetical protein